MTIKRLFGFEPNQVSMNRDLGTMAFQDANNVTLDNLGVNNIWMKTYTSTSTSGGTSIIDTGIIVSNFDNAAAWMVFNYGDPNNAGSSAYRSSHVGILLLATGWNGSAATNYLNYTSLASNAPVGVLSITPAFFKAADGTEVAAATGVAAQSSDYQIRLKISGYNTSYPGAYEMVRMSRIG